MIRAVKIGDKNGFLITKAGLAMGAGFLGAAIMGVIVGWIALNNTHSLSNEDHELVFQLQKISAYQEYQINEAREANCKLKLYDILSGKAGTVLFKRAHVLDKTFEEGISHTLEVIESIPSASKCTGIFVVPRGTKSKKQVGGLIPSDIENANKILGVILEKPSSLKREILEKIENNKKKKNKLRHKIAKNKKIENISPPSSTIPSMPPIAVSSQPTATHLPIEKKLEKNEEKKIEHEKLKQEKKEKHEKCIIEVGSLSKEIKVCN